MMTWLKTEAVLVELNLRGCNITNLLSMGSCMVDDIAEMLSNNKHLKSIDLSYNTDIGDEGFKKIIKVFRAKKNTKVDTLKMKMCSLGVESGLLLLGYLEWKVDERDTEIKAMAKQHEKLDYWKLKGLQTWGLQTVDLKHQFKREVLPSNPKSIRTVESKIEFAAKNFATKLPTKKIDVVVVSF